MEQEKRIYTIGTAHLDTVWNWDFEHVLSVCLPNTLKDNFSLFAKYPDYKFNFEGAYRYELFEEYYPDEFEILKQFVAQGRWAPCGSSYENGDVNVPSPESLLRNILYGNRYFQSRFGCRSNDIYLPDCFGFGYALPSIAAHAGLRGFSTQKLTWGSTYGIPFDIGRWQGPDGKQIFASLDPKSYCTVFKQIRTDKNLLKKLKKNEKDYGLPWTFAYHGVGDVGGAPKEESVKTLQDEMAQNDTQEIKVLSASTTQFFDDLAALDESEQNRLPLWNNELTMTNHGAGSYTSRAFGKRCNRKNEELASMTERAAVIANKLCGAAYPKEAIDFGWKKTIAHTFHDDLTGTSVERVYKRSWNDYILAANRLSSAFEGAVGEIARNIDTSWTKGIAVVVSNSLEQSRMAPVDLTVPAAGYKYVRVFEKGGREVPSQILANDENNIKFCFCAAVPALGFKAFDVLYSYEPCKLNVGVRTSGNVIENFKYIVTVNAKGDISSIIDKTIGKELLEKPIRFELNKYEGNKAYPAWELTFDEVKKYPWEFAENGEVELIEKGPVRATLKVTQTAGKSKFVRYVSLWAGGQWVDVKNEVEWREFSRILHNGFSFTAHSKNATYDLGLGVIKRGVMRKKLYAVPAQKWVDLSDLKKNFGVSVFSDSKYGWMQKDESTLRMTVVHTPKNYYRHDSVQGMMDFGLNRYGYAIFSHAGEWNKETQQNAAAFHQPLTAVITDTHPGALGNSYSFGKINTDGVLIRAIKLAEDSDEIIVRVNEATGRHIHDVSLTLGEGIEYASEVNGQEDVLSAAIVEDGALVFDLAPFEVKSFALSLLPARRGICAEQRTLPLDYNHNIITFNHNRGDASIPTIGVSVPGEQFPKSVDCAGIHFELAPSFDKLNAMVSAGQRIRTEGNRLYFLAASLYGDKTYEFKVGARKEKVRVQAINERVGGWDLYHLAETAFVKTDRLALEFTHTHGDDKDNRGQELYFFLYSLSTEDVDEVTFPQDNGLLVLAASETLDCAEVLLATPLYERVEKRAFDFEMSAKEKKQHQKQMKKNQKPTNQS